MDATARLEPWVVSLLGVVKIAACALRASYAEISVELSGPRLSSSRDSLCSGVAARGGVAHGVGASSGVGAGAGGNAAEPDRRQLACLYQRVLHASPRPASALGSAFALEAAPASPVSPLLLPQRAAQAAAGAAADAAAAAA